MFYEARRSASQNLPFDVEIEVAPRNIPVVVQDAVCSPQDIEGSRLSLPSHGCVIASSVCGSVGESQSNVSFNLFFYLRCLLILMKLRCFKFSLISAKWCFFMLLEILTHFKSRECDVLKWKKVKYIVGSKTTVCPVSGLTLDEAVAFLGGVRARRAAYRR